MTKIAKKKVIIFMKKVLFLVKIFYGKNVQGKNNKRNNRKGSYR